MSQDGASQFQEVIRQELELSVKKELEKILITAPSHEFEVRTLQCFLFHSLHAELLLLLMIIQFKISTRCNENIKKLGLLNN